MEPASNKYALAAIRERRAEVSGEIVTLERRLRYLRGALVHIDGTLRLFAPDADPSTIPAKKPYRRVKLFGAGRLNAHILTVLRKAARPLTTLEVVAGVVEEVNFGPDAAAGMKARVRANLLYLSKVRQLVVKEGERETAVWRLAD